MPKADLVLEGGGVKGLGLVGAVLELQRQGYTFARLAGTSAGSIVAAFLAAGATADQLTAIMGRLDYRKVPDRAGVPGVGEGLGLLRPQRRAPRELRPRLRARRARAARRHDVRRPRAGRSW